MTRRCRAREAGASPQARWVCCSPIDGGTTRFARDCQCGASALWTHGWSTASVRRHGTIERPRWDGATLGIMTRRCRAREAGASPQARWVCCSPIDGGTTRFARDCQCGASALWTHGWSTASVRRHGTIERPRWDGATLSIMTRRCRAREAGASPQARWVCCSPIDGGTTRFARDCQCGASALWTHGWSTASVRRHGTIERPRWDGATLGIMTRRCRAREAGASPQARWVCCSPIDGGTTRFARDCQCGASALWTHGWSTASVRRHGTIERPRWDGATLGIMTRRCRAREAGASPQARWVCCSPIDGGTTRFARDCQCGASALWTHGWSTASVRRHGTIERPRWDGATLGIVTRRCRAREAGASPQARWVCCSPIDGGTTRFARDCECGASALWTHGWSTASVRRHGTIERPRWDGAALGTVTRRRRQHSAVSVERSLGQLRGVEHAASWPRRQPRQARSAQRQVLCGRSAGSPRDEARARRAPRDENESAMTVRSRSRQHGAVSVERSLGQRRGVEHTASWPRRQPRQARSAQRQVALWAVGWFSTRRSARAPRATGRERVSNDGSKPQPPTRRGVGAEEPRPTAWGGARRELATQTTAPSTQRAESKGSVGGRLVLHVTKRARAARHGTRTSQQRRFEAAAADTARCRRRGASANGVGWSTPRVGHADNRAKHAARREQVALWAVGWFST